ncbi:MAG TPA: HypC/HybG/HupF family hydrogenase formation chaperone [Acidilobales archaeon]|nr:HypC/HybG/HupF family hydrogenase formation chaperone [Acidilobales archaeon]
MCLGVPAKIVEIYENSGMRYAKVDLGGVVKDVIVVTSEDLGIGDYVIVHAGMAISKIREEEVKEITELLNELSSEL